MSWYKPRRAIGAAIIFLAFVFFQPVGAGLPLTPETPTLAPLVKEVPPGVVNIATRGRVWPEQDPLFSDPGFRQFFDDPALRRFFGIPDEPVERETQSVGSGAIVDAEQGYVVTNHHVIAQADQILVTFKGGRQLESELLGSDPETDVAVLKVEPKNLQALPFGDSDRLEVGDYVVAIGNPFGLGQTVTAGIVSALGRRAPAASADGPADGRQPGAYNSDIAMESASIAHAVAFCAGCRIKLRGRNQRERTRAMVFD